MTVSGSIVLQGATLPPPPLARVTVSLVSAQNEVNLGVAAAPVDEKGQFTISGVTPGRYRLSVNLPGARPDAPGWAPKSATIGGQDALDSFYSLKSSVDGAVITLTDTPIELTGTVQDGSRRPAPDCQVVVFPADRQVWTAQSRRIQSVRPTSTGTYTFRNLPAGEYFLAAVVDIEPGEQYDPTFLQRLSGAAFRIVLTDGEKKTQDIRIDPGV